MTEQGWSVAVLRDWEGAAGLREEWRELQRRSDTPSPFTTFDWFDAWYRAYCRPNDVRVILVRKDGRLHAILPGMAERRWLGGMHLTCFVYAGSCYTPRCGLIAAPGDLDAGRRALLAVTELDETIHLGILPDVEAGSLTWRSLVGKLPEPCRVRSETQYQAPIYVMPEGWTGFLANHSKKFRSRLRQSMKRCEAKGLVSSAVFRSGRNLGEGIERLRQLEGRTWQGPSGWGVLRSACDDDFYRRLAKIDPSELRLEIELMQIDRQDVAFMLLACLGDEVFLLRTGFDLAYDDCRPGVVVRALVSERLAAEGMVTFDLGAHVYEEKRRWETGRRDYESFWLINRGTFRGRFLMLEVWLYDRLKPLLRRGRRPPEHPVETPSPDDEEAATA